MPGSTDIPYADRLDPPHAYTQFNRSSFVDRCVRFEVIEKKEEQKKGDQQQQQQHKVIVLHSFSHFIHRALDVCVGQSDVKRVTEEKGKNEPFPRTNFHLKR